MSPESVTVEIQGKVRRRWALRLSAWCLGLVRIDVMADGRRIGSAPLRFTVSVDPEEEEAG